MKNSVWVVIVVSVAFLGFLIGYSVSSYTGIQKIQKGYVREAEAGGYGAESGGYGAESGGYGQSSPEQKEGSEEYGERTDYFGE